MFIINDKVLYTRKGCFDKTKAIGTVISIDGCKVNVLWKFFVGGTQEWLHYSSELVLFYRRDK